MRKNIADFYITYERLGFLQVLLWQIGYNIDFIYNVGLWIRREKRGCLRGRRLDLDFIKRRIRKNDEMCRGMELICTWNKKNLRR